MKSPVLPSYDQQGLVGILPRIGQALAGSDTLPASKRYVLLLVDGFGWNLLQEFQSQVPSLQQFLPSAEQLTCSVPSTTATSITSLGVARPPGQHGIVGYRFREPTTGEIMNALSWENGPEDVSAFQPCESLFAKLPDQDVLTTSVNLARFEHSALTCCAFADANFVPLFDEADVSGRVAAIAEAAARNQLIYCYERLLDHEGHTYGVGSYQWLDALEHVEDLIEQLIERLPSDTCLLVTGDHGMINVAKENQIIIEEETGLMAAEQVGGEARFRHLYTDRAEELAHNWAAHLGEKAWVKTKTEAIAEGWFGEVSPRVAPRLGDVVVAMRDEWALMTSTHPVEMNLVGMHGSLTPAEMLVPLLKISI